MNRFHPLLLLFLGACAPESRTVEDLISDSSRLYSTLEPGLRDRAEAYLREFQEKGVRYQGRPSILVHEGGRLEETYQSPDGKERRVIARQTFELQAVETVVHFKIRDIPSIALHASDRFPFEGEVEITAMVLTRTAKRPVTLHPVPEGWTSVPDAPVREGQVRVAAGNPRSYEPLPVPVEPVALREDLPQEVRTAAYGVMAQCLRSKQTVEPTLYAMSFVYSAAEKTWKVKKDPRKL